MVTKKKTQEALLQGDAKGAIGIGLLGAIGSLGPVAIIGILLAVLAIGVISVILFLPFILAGIMTVLTYWGSKFFDIHGRNRAIAGVIAGVGSFLLFNFVGVSVLSSTYTGVSSMIGSGTVSGGVSAQGLSIIDFILNPLSVVAGTLFTVLVLAMMWAFSKIKTYGPVLSGVIGLIGSYIVLTQFFDFAFSTGVKVTGVSDVPFSFIGGLFFVVSLIIGIICVWFGYKVDKEW